jgi:hypothetical protein
VTTKQLHNVLREALKKDRNGTAKVVFVGKSGKELNFKPQSYATDNTGRLILYDRQPEGNLDHVKALPRP